MSEQARGTMKYTTDADNEAPTHIEAALVSENTKPRKHIAKSQYRVGAAIRSVRVNPRLLQTLEALERQTLQPEEVIIAIPDDLAQDELSTWRQLVARSVLPIRLVEGPGGMIPQRETCLYAAHAELLLLLDDDIVLGDVALEVMVRTAREHNAQCVMPYVPSAFPSGLYRWAAAIFLMEVPYAGSGGIKCLPHGGYKYPSVHLEPGAAAETDVGIGWAILVDRDWSLRHHCTGDYRLQTPDIMYPLREDGAFTCALLRAGAKLLVVNIGEVRHLGGTTLLDPRRLLWEYEATIHNNCVYWYHYFYRHHRSIMMRLISSLSFAWMLVGVHVMALASSIRRRSLLPMRGLIRGYGKLIQLMSRQTSKGQAVV